MPRTLGDLLRPALLGAVLLTGALLPGIAGDAAAQGGLFDKAKDLMGNLGGTGAGAGTLSDDEIAGGLREALRVGSERVVAQVGVLDGFNADPKIHIPLPGTLQKVQSALRTVGMSSLTDDLELKLNRAAEAAAPEAKRLFLQAIDDMTLDDARKILGGPEDAATQYFKGKMSPPLAEKMTPVVDDSLAEVGAVQSYDRMMGQYQSIPFMPDAKADLTGYVVQRAMDGIFFYMGQEEAAIRSDPAARTTELLKKVFGSG